MAESSLLGNVVLSRRRIAFEKSRRHLDLNIKLGFASLFLDGRVNPSACKLSSILVISTDRSTVKLRAREGERLTHDTRTVPRIAHLNKIICGM